MVFIPICPECAGIMKWDSRQRRYVCQRCGLALKYREIEEIREKYRNEIEKERGKDWEAEQRKKEYLKWWLSKKE
ncbi:MAG: hypothetical protein ACTSPQ_11125 [Candidatus Helarchaeota archaeon]